MPSYTVQEITTYIKENGVDGLFSLREGLNLEMSELSRIRSSKLEDE